MLSALDSRYFGQMDYLNSIFSEESQLKLKYNLEIDYLTAIAKTLSLKIDEEFSDKIKSMFNSSAINKIELEETKHDIKAIENYIARGARIYGQENLIPYIHFGLTSQDINSLATSISILKYRKYLLKKINELSSSLFGLISQSYFPMLGRTHGQPAVTTSLAKELDVFKYRLDMEAEKISNIKIMTKCGGALGNLSAHYLSFPEINWIDFMSSFSSSYGLERLEVTTQVDGNDWLAEFMQAQIRINNILLDLTRDIWMYFSFGYFSKKITGEEIGSSTMPQKINPIEFENAEGNLELSSSILSFMSSKFQVSRLQRDLSDSTVMRNLGVPFGHFIVACNSICNGLNKIYPNKDIITRDLLSHPEILAEAVQILLRKEGIENAYDITKNMIMANKSLSRKEYEEFVFKLQGSEALKIKLLKLDVLGY
jgi:adenylosuccinate lyase